MAARTPFFLTIKEKKHRIEVQTPRLEVVFADNHKIGRVHRRGYNGIAYLSPYDAKDPKRRRKIRWERSVFVPKYGGLNFELIFDGLTGASDSAEEREILFEPRRAPMSISYEARYNSGQTWTAVIERHQLLIFVGHILILHEFIY